MEQFYYEDTAVVENADADCHSLLKASALLRYVEQISSMHARKFGMDDKFFEDHGVAFLVGKQALDISCASRAGRWRDTGTRRWKRNCPFCCISAGTA